MAYCTRFYSLKYNKSNGVTPNLLLAGNFYILPVALDFCLYTSNHFLVRIKIWRHEEHYGGRYIRDRMVVTSTLYLWRNAILPQKLWLHFSGLTVVKTSEYEFCNHTGTRRSPTRTLYPVYTAIIFRKYGVQVRKIESIVTERYGRDEVYSIQLVSWDGRLFITVPFVNKFDGYDITK